LITLPNPDNYPYYHQLKEKQLFKAKEPLYDTLQEYNDNLIDKKVNLYYQNYDEEDNFYDSFSTAMIFATLFNMNYRYIVKDFNKLLKNPFIKDNPLFMNIVKHSAEKTTKLIAEKETERVVKNIGYVDRILKESKIDIDKYNSMVSSGLSRKEILEKTITEGKTYSGQDLSYKQLNNLAKDLEGYKSHRVDYDTALLINQEAVANGLPPVYTHKRWIWSQLEKTRHSNMDGEVIELEERFTVTNEVTGDVDFLLFPGDVENYSNVGNVINCKCDVEYLINQDAVQGIGEYNANVGKVYYKNSLSEEQIKYFDDLLGTKIPKESRISHKLYSTDSNIVNDYLSISNKNFMKNYGENGVKIAEKQIKGLNASKIVTNEDLIVYKGFKTTKNIDVSRINDKNRYVSTSLDKAVAIGYTRGAGNYISIKIPKGTEVIYIRKYSEYPNHMEILITPEYYIHESKINGRLIQEVKKRQ